MNSTRPAAVRAREYAPISAPALLLTTKEAAAFLRLHYHTLEVWRSTGRYPELPYVRVGRHAVRYRMSDLERFVDREAVPAPGIGETACE